MKEEYFYLYIIKFPNDKYYIGQSIQPNKRWLAHQKSASNNPTQVVHSAINKYGSNNCIFEVIACCMNQEDANDIETLLVTQYNSHISQNGYNVSNGGINAPKTDAWKQHMSIIMKQKWMDGTLQSPWALMDTETIEKRNKNISLGKMGQNHTEESKNKMSKSHKNISDETRHKMSIAKIGKPSWNAGIKGSIKPNSGSFKIGGEAPNKGRKKIIDENGNIRYIRVVEENGNNS